MPSVCPLKTKASPLSSNAWYRPRHKGSKPSRLVFSFVHRLPVSTSTPLQQRCRSWPCSRVSHQHEAFQPCLLRPTKSRARFPLAAPFLPISLRLPYSMLRPGAGIFNASPRFFPFSFPLFPFPHTLPASRRCSAVCFLEDAAVPHAQLPHLLHHPPCGRLAVCSLEDTASTSASPDLPHILSRLSRMTGSLFIGRHCRHIHLSHLV
jgi:hypothetical protein